MLEIFNFFGGILGYLLWALYLIVRNYGVAIIIFTVILRVLMFPTNIKQQKNMAAQAKVQAKAKELQEKYGNNRQKYSEELQKLYDKEGVSPTGGCLTTLLPFPIMFGIYYSVLYPLQNVLHIGKDVIDKATSVMQTIPGVSAQFISNQNIEMDIIRHFDTLKVYLTDVFSTSELDQIGFLSKGFRFLGLDLLQTPAGSDFLSFMWIIPVLCLVSAWLSQLVMNRTNPAMAGQGGCMKVMMYGLPLMSAYFAYVMPGAVGFYWVISTFTTMLATVITNKFFSQQHLIAKMEAQRAALRYQEEAAVKELPLPVQRQLKEKAEAAKAAVKNPQGGKKSESTKKPSSKKKASDNTNSSAYLGSKK